MPSQQRDQPTQQSCQMRGGQERRGGQWVQCTRYGPRAKAQCEWRVCKGAREGGGTRARRTEPKCKENWHTRVLELSSSHSKYSQHTRHKAERDHSQSQGRAEKPEIKFCRGSASPKKTQKARWKSQWPLAGQGVCWSRRQLVGLENAAQGGGENVQWDDDSNTRPNLENEGNSRVWPGVRPVWEPIRTNQHDQGTYLICSCLRSAEFLPSPIPCEARGLIDPAIARK